MKRLAIMQPYFFPYIGYFQLIRAVDRFVIYDNIQYTKKGWINRNRFLLDGADQLFSVPLKNAAEGLNVVDRQIADDFRKDKLLNRLREAYRHAPYFERVFPIVENSVRQQETNLFKYIYRSLRDTCDYLEIETEFVIASSVPVAPALTGKEKVIGLCQDLGAEIYINPIGGQDLYAREDFRACGIELQFLKSKPYSYPQFNREFVPWLSIIDVMMFNRVGDIKNYLVSGYELI